MVERASNNPPLIDGNQYKNLSYKVRNRVLSDNVAWEEVVQHIEDTRLFPDFHFLIPFGLLEEAFFLRRHAYLKEIEDWEASKKIKEAYEKLPLSEQFLHEKPLVFIRDLFARQLSYKRAKKG